MQGRRERAPDILSELESVKCRRGMSARILECNNSEQYRHSDFNSSLHFQNWKVDLPVSVFFFFFLSFDIDLFRRGIGYNYTSLWNYYGLWWHGPRLDSFIMWYLTTPLMDGVQVLAYKIPLSFWKAPREKFGLSYKYFKRNIYFKKKFDQKHR